MQNDFDFKSLTREELTEIFGGVDFLLEPMQHQLISLAFAADKKRAAFLLDVGTGKTLTSLYSNCVWNWKKALVICPSSAFPSWRRDLSAHTNFTYQFVTGSTKERRNIIKNEVDVSVIAYTALKTVHAKLCKGEGWVIQEDSFIHDFDLIIIDEAHKCGNHASLQSQICYELSKRAEYVIGMTGTLLDKSYLELFGIYRVIDLGKSLGSNFFAYRYTYFDKEIRGSKFGRKWVEWVLKSGMEEEILNRISNVSISFSREECFELPPIQKIFKFVHPSPQFLQLQEALINKKPLQFSKVRVVVAKKIKSIAYGLRELPSGFMYYGEDKQVGLITKNPKVEALLDLLEDSSSKMIVFYTFREERNIISKALKKEKIPFSSVYGGQETDREEEITRFSTDPDCRVLLSQISVATEGFDAFEASAVVFFSPLSSPKKIKQCIGRMYRKGQTKKTLVITFVMEDSFEEHVIVNRSERFNLVREAAAYISLFHKGSEEGNV